MMSRNPHPFRIICLRYFPAFRPSFNQARFDDALLVS
jgi:hypothetical protein